MLAGMRQHGGMGMSRFVLDASKVLRGRRILFRAKVSPRDRVEKFGVRVLVLAFGRRDQVEID